MNGNKSSANEGSSVDRWKEFGAQLKRLWERDGNIQESLKLISGHPELQNSANDTGRRQLLRVLGERRLVSGGVVIPERLSTTAFDPIPERVMYCVYSTPVYNSNGYSTRTRGVAAGLKSAGADVVVVARAGYPWDWKIDTETPARERTVAQLDGIDYVHLPNGAMDGLSPSAHIEQAADAFVQEALIQRPSFIQAASNYRVAMPALIAARRLGIPFIYEVRGLWEITGASNDPGFENTDRYRFMRDYESRVARAADHVFAITNQVKNELVSRGVERSKISLAPNAVDPGKFQPIRPTVDMAASMGLEPGVPVVGFAGSIVKYEGLHTLLEASRILAERGVEHQIAMAGSGNTEQSLKQFAAVNEMDWVHFLGRIPQEQVPVLLGVSDIIVTPRDSTVITELVSALKPLEAFSAGRAVVLSNVAPNLDLAGPNQERARVFSAGNPSDLAEAIEDLIQDQAVRVKLAKTARNWIETERNWSAIGRLMFEEIKTTDEKHSRSAMDGIQLSSLSVGILGQNDLISVLSRYVTVVSLEAADFETDSLPALDFVIVDFSQNKSSSGISDSASAAIFESRTKSILEDCGSFAVPRIGLFPGGLHEGHLDFEYFALLDLCLTGKYDGVVKLLEDPETIDLRIGTYPPVLEIVSGTHRELQATSEAAWVADELGVASRSMDGLIAMIDPDQVRGASELIKIQEIEEDDDSTVPTAIYIRHSAPEWIKRRLISLYSLEIPLVWESEGETSNWFGSAFAEGVHLIEFIAGYHQWNKDASKRSSFVLRQRKNLLSAHSIESRLVLLSRGLGIPVSFDGVGKIRAEGNSEQVDPIKSFGSEELTALLRDKADEIAPVLLQSLRV